MPQPGLKDGKEQLHKDLDLEIRDMISTLTNRLTSFQRLQKTTDPDGVEELEVDHGVRIITLAGNNIGATMRGAIDDKNTTLSANLGQGMVVGDQEQEDALRTYVNSNFQAINNSIMMGGSYTTQDPGVHMDISDYLENKPSSSSNSNVSSKKGEKNLPGGSKRDQQTDQPDSE